MTRPRGAEAGFSLAELMVAMTITLIITGAIYALIAGGGTAFRREPAVSDRQQNIRMAMDLITRDAQAGTNFLSANAKGITGPNGTTDGVWMFIPSPDCPQAPVTDVSGVNLVTGPNGIPSCFHDDALVIVVYMDGSMQLGYGHNIHTDSTKLNFPNGQGPADDTGTQINDLLTITNHYSTDCNPPTAATAASCPQALVQGDLVKWQIANDTDGVPSLWRSSTGGYDFATGNTVAPSSPTWQLVARGVEDLQARYRVQTNYDPANLTTGWTDNPTGGSGNYGNAVRELEITLQARTVNERALQGETTSGGVTAIRGQLKTVIVPRYTITRLINASPSPLYQ